MQVLTPPHTVAPVSCCVWSVLDKCTSITPQRTTLTSFVTHTLAIFSSLQISVPHLLTSTVISPFSPWLNSNFFFSVDFYPLTVSDTSLEAAAQIFQDLVNFEYSSHTARFTDGSHVSTPSHSTSAAVAIPSRGVLLKWKLCPDVQVIKSELFAIREGLSWSQTKPIRKHFKSHWFTIFNLLDKR